MAVWWVIWIFREKASGGETVELRLTILKTWREAVAMASPATLRLHVRTSTGNPGGLPLSCILMSPSRSVSPSGDSPTFL